jgi:hypothetical protein
VRITNQQAADWWHQSNQNLTKCLNLAVAYALRIERAKHTKPKRKDKPYVFPFTIT